MSRSQLFASLLVSFLITFKVHSAVILQYHHVSEDTPASTSISPKLFATHLDYLAEQGYTVWPLPQLVNSLKAGDPIPDKVVVITFDDAYDSIYQRAFPLLKARSMPFTVFVAPQSIEQKSAPFMTWAELKEMTQAGATIANHSFAHKHLVRRLENESESDWLARIEDDIEQAQSILTERMGEVPKLLAYPYGEYTDALAERIASLGYVAFGQQSGAVSSQHGLNQHGLTGLPRYPMTDFYGEMSQFKAKVASLPFPEISVSPDQRIIAKGAQPDSLKIELYPQKVNAQQLSCFFSGQGRIPAKVSSNDKALTIEIEDLPEMRPGRSRLNCTAPSADPQLAGRFHWFSYFWMRKKDDGSWYEEE